MGNTHSSQRRRRIDRRTISRPISAYFPDQMPADIDIEDPEHEAAAAAALEDISHDPYVSDAPLLWRHSSYEPRWGAKLYRRASQEGYVPTPHDNPAPPPPLSRLTRISRVIEDNLPFHHTSSPRVRLSRIGTTPRRRSRLSQIFHDLGDRHNREHSYYETPQRLPLGFTAPDTGVPGLGIDFAAVGGDYESSDPDQVRAYTQHSPQPQPQDGNLSDRISSLTPARELSRLRSLRRRNRPRRNLQEMGSPNSMSNILTLAAHALAATLTGNNSHNAVEELRRAAAGVEPDDGSLDAFMQFLQSGRLSSHLARSMAAGDGGATDGGNAASASTAAATTAVAPAADNQPPLDFFRMFQLRSTMRVNNPSGNDEGESSAAGAAEGDEGRMVPVLIVGIRSLQHDGNGQETDTNSGMPNLIDHLTRAQSSEATPTLTSADRPGEASPSTRSSRPTSVYHPRGNTNSTLSSSDPRRQTWHSEAGLPTASSTPLGPSPPPTTPASAPLSALPSGVTTPNATMSEQRDSPLTSSPEHRDRASRRHSWLSRSRDDRSPSPTRRRSTRRGNGMDFLRHGSGSARRRGIIGPDRPPPEGNRSWIIYVLGGNYPVDHPILTAPSLFTDSPSYEDMLLLSSLIGPARPPVATTEEVNAAGGLYTIRQQGVTELLEAISTDTDSEVFFLESSQTCGICLTTYNQDEVVRRLPTCHHFYHRECVDQWLTTGRNSCPLCRVKAVPDRNSDTPAPSPSPIPTDPLAD